MKTAKKITGMLLFLSVSAVSVAPAIAETTSEANQTFTISQLEGHDTYNKEPQMDMSKYILGTVVGQAGDLVSVKLSDGKVFQAPFYDPSNPYVVGSNVLVMEENGVYSVVGLAHPAWITPLVDNYGLKLIVPPANP
jgi:hypothetical protein